MKQQSINAIKLGIFVLLSLALLIFSLYFLGKNKSFFGDSFELKTHFRDVNGLLVGNNVRLSGIDVGSVQDIEILNDTIIEVTLNIEKAMRKFVRNNSVATLGTDGLIGNRIINITPVSGIAPIVENKQLLPSREEVNTAAMLETLSKTNEDISAITKELRTTVQRINNSTTLTDLLNDKSLNTNLRASLTNLNKTSTTASILMDNAVSTLRLASEGNGTLATLLTDSTLAVGLLHAVKEVQNLEKTANNLALKLDEVVHNVDTVVHNIEGELMSGKGIANGVLRDSTMTEQLRHTLENVELGSAAFAEDMEALKSNFLFRRYFRKQRKKAEKAKGN